MVHVKVPKINVTYGRRDYRRTVRRAWDW